MSDKLHAILVSMDFPDTARKLMVQRIPDMKIQQNKVEHFCGQHSGRILSSKCVHAFPENTLFKLYEDFYTSVGFPNHHSPAVKLNIYKLLIE